VPRYARIKASDWSKVSLGLHARLYHDSRFAVEVRETR
jgi:hypothetical protein